MQLSFIPIKKLDNEPYASILGYPKSTKSQVKSRIKELKKLGIISVAFHGKLNLGPVNVLGKGYVGIVVLAKNKNKKVLEDCYNLESFFDISFQTFRNS